jgi:hypothetical protein
MKTEPTTSLAGVASAAPCSPDWSRVSWRRLEKGEIIQLGDWFDACIDGWRDEPIWKPVERRIGKPAPDPAYPSHTTFRRIIQANTEVARESGE